MERMRDAASLQGFLDAPRTIIQHIRILKTVCGQLTSILFYSGFSPIPTARKRVLSTLFVLSKIVQKSITITQDIKKKFAESYQNKCCLLVGPHSAKKWTEEDDAASINTCGNVLTFDTSYDEIKKILVHGVFAVSVKINLTKARLWTISFFGRVWFFNCDRESFHFC